ncbi:MAG: hypothetical protein DA408_16800 [Bacteroidetes bacterium]|nr:MAG: hypothetical protein C7N36_10450 [Bacteroidota bacterium]PTM10098.1 MAG: hypothetical protein DA408_16800 [Bacteroidota bacterium]
MNEVERRQLKDWLASPVHNRREEVCRLFAHIDNYLHHLRLPLDREQVYRSLYPSRVFDDLHLRQLCHYLLQSTETWLAWRNSDSTPTPSLLAEYRARGLGRLFEHSYKKAIQTLEKSTHRHPEYYWQHYLLARERYAWDSARGRLGNLNLEHQEELLQVALLGFKLRQAYLSLAPQQLSDMPVNIPMLDAVLANAATAKQQAIPMVRIYYLAIQLYRQTEEDAVFEQFSEAFRAHSHIFTTDEARDLLLLGINFGIRRINTEQGAYLRACLLLFQQGLDTELLLEDGRLNTLTYNNIAGIAIRLLELDWASTFLETYRTRLDSRDREAVYALNAARLAYTRRDYAIALQLLRTCNDLDFVHQMSARILQLKIHVDNQEIDLALNHIRNTRTYLKRQPNTGYHKENYRNILLLSEHWCKRPAYDQEKYHNWLTAVKNTHPLTERAWLLGLI